MTRAAEAERLLDEARAGRAEIGDALRALVDADVLLVLADGGDPGQPAHPVTTTDAQGRPVVPVFTSEGRVPAELGAHRRLANRLRTLLDGWPQAVGLVVNPGSDAALAIPAADLPALRDAPAVDEAPAGLHVALGEPAEEPRELLTRFAAAAGTVPEALALYRAQAVWRGAEEEAGLLVGLRIAEGSDGDAVLARVVEQVGPRPERFDAFAFDDPDADDPLVRHLVARTAPVWQRRG